jgi:quercetin dioxygenase-like cupin family protein
MKFFLSLSSILLLSYCGFTQTNLVELTQDSIHKNVEVKRLCHEPYQSCFAIWVNDTVKPHYHSKHTETIYVVKGGGTFYIGNKKMELKKGDLVTIPQNSVHSFKNNSKEGTQVLSIQAPQFFGKDRIWVKSQFNSKP